MEASDILTKIEIELNKLVTNWTGDSSAEYFNESQELLTEIIQIYNAGKNGVKNENSIS